MKTIKRPGFVIALNVAVVVILAAVVAYVVHRANTPAAAPPIQVLKAVPPAGGVGAPYAAALPSSMQLAYAASHEYQGHDYAGCMRDSDLALNLLRSEKQSKETRTIIAQVDLTAARAAKAKGSPDAEARYLGELKIRVHQIRADPAAFPSEKKGAQEILDAALALEASHP